MSDLPYPDITAAAFCQGIADQPEPRLLIIWQTSCPYCGSFEEVMPRYAHRLERWNPQVLRIEAADSPLWDRFRLNQVPAFYWYQAGKVVARYEGIRSATALQVMLAEVEALPFGEGDLPVTNWDFIPETVCELPLTEPGAWLRQRT